MATKEIRKEKAHNKKRKEIRSKKQLTSVPVDAVDKLNAFLEVDKSKDKEFKLAALFIEDESGHISIEDVDLRGDSAENIKLSDYAINKKKYIADQILFNSNAVKLIANKVNSMVADTERYYAFEITKENVEAGRHGKTKKKIVNDFVMLLDLNEKELKRIANLSF
jgi:hypothetical protein